MVPMFETVGMSRRKAFSLPEALVVISIIMLLASLLYPVMAASKARAKSTACASNLSQIHKAITLYMADADDTFPEGKDCLDLYPPVGIGAEQFNLMKPLPLLADILQPYCSSRQIFRCPSDSGAKVDEGVFPSPVPLVPTAFGQCGNSYGYATPLGLAHIQGTIIQHPSAFTLDADLAGHWHGSSAAADPGESFSQFMAKTWGYRYNVVYVDGHTKNLSYRENEAGFREY